MRRGNIGIPAIVSVCLCERLGEKELVFNRQRKTQVDEPNNKWRSHVFSSTKGGYISKRPFSAASKV